MERFTSALVPLIAGLLLVTTGVRASCPLELSASRVVVKLGGSVSINCSTPEKEFEGMGWEATRNGIPLTNKSHLTWTVENLDSWDAPPSCFFNPSGNSAAKQCVVSPDVVLYTFPESINITSNTSRVMTLQEGCTLTCEIERVEPVQNLSIRWFRNRQPFDNATLKSTDKKPRTVVSVIQLKASREENEAVYRCEAHLDLRPEGPYLTKWHEYNVTVHYGPEINCSSSSLTVNEGTALEKVCGVTGNPIPTVKWLKGGQPINPNTLLTRDKAGPYTLTAKGHTSVDKNLTIYVSYGPELMCESNQTVMEHVPFTLKCTVAGYPKPELALFKDGMEVFLPERLGREHEGSYVISASIGQQTVESRINISVIYPPSLITELEDSEVDVGHNVSLKCTSKGNPRPKYFWDYYRTANVIEKYEDEVSYLIISNATVDNMDFYTCSVQNDVGKVSKTVKLTVKGVEPECPIEIFPNRTVVPYGSRGQPAQCLKVSKHRPRDLAGYLYWEDQQSYITYSSYWSVDIYDNWNIKADCVAKFKGIPECKKQLDITVYKTPDSVFINHLNYSSSVVEGQEFQLQCNITNVAPVSKLAVRWYQGNQTFEPRNKGTMQVTGCQNDADCDLSLIRTPVNVLVTISVTLKREHSGAMFWCEAHLDLGPEGPQPPPTNMSNPLNLTVHYKPTINATKLPKTIPVFSGYPEELICEADGNPPPLILWLQSSDDEPRVDKPTLTVYKAGLYRCNATNIVASVSHQVEVILKEDYLPLIAGFVAVAVIIISVVFVFIYSIYYKNTKMRRYSLKNPKLSTHNGNVAHNGWEFQFPMKRLS